MSSLLKGLTKTDLDNATPNDAPSDVEFWTMVQRYFSLEEPSSRWSKLSKSLQKQLRKRGINSSDFDSMTLVERSRIFSQIFGFGNGVDQISSNDFTSLIEDQDRRIQLLDLVNQTVGVFLAFEDTRRIANIAFDSWRLEDNFESLPSDTEFTCTLAKEFNLSEAEIAWLNMAQISKINWSRLLYPGPWSQDPTAQFINHFSEELLGKLTSSKNPQESLKKETIELLNFWSSTLRSFRKKLPGSFLPNVVVLVEGQSEEILLPTFGELRDLDFSVNGIEIRSCGGAKQIVKQYLNLRDTIELPMISIFDADVSEESQIIKDSLRDIDRLHVLKSGELEDSFTEQAFISHINHYIQKIGSTRFIKVQELNPHKPRVQQMANIWGRKNIGTFDKVEFAKITRDNIKETEIPYEFNQIIESIRDCVDASRKRCST